MLDWRPMRVLHGLLGLAISFCAGAQSFPGRPVQLIVPNAPGGAIDIMARLFAQHLQPIWGQPAVVEYKPGAGTALGTEIVAKAAPDGHTLLFAVTSHVINPSLRKLPFNTVKDFSGVTMDGVSHILLCASPGLPAKTLPELIALARSRPGKLKPIAITSLKRTRAAPEIPTVAETIPGFEVQSVFGVVVPSATPRGIVRRLNEDFLKVLQVPAMRARLQEFGVEPVGNSPEQFDAYIRDAVERWNRVVRAAGIRLD